AGTRHLLTHGIQSDYAVVADGSDLNVVWAQTGVVQVKITTFGQPEAAWGTKRDTHPPAKLNVGAIEGGAPYRPNYSPGVCSIYLDVRTPPGLRPVTVLAELEQVLR